MCARKVKDCDGHLENNVQERGLLFRDAVGEKYFDEFERLKDSKLSLPESMKKDLNRLVEQSVYECMSRRDMFGRRECKIAAPSDVSMLQNPLSKFCTEGLPASWNDVCNLYKDKGGKAGSCTSGGGLNLLTLCVDGPDCSGKTSLLSLMEQVDMARMPHNGRDAVDESGEMTSIAEVRLRFEVLFRELRRRQEAGETQVLSSFLTSYPDSSMAEATKREIGMPLCQSWQHPNACVSPTGKTIREWLATQDALSGAGELPPVSVQAAFTQSWTELMEAIRSVEQLSWEGLNGEASRTGKVRREARKSPVHLIDRSVVSMVVYGLLGGVSAEMLWQLASFYPSVPVLLLNPSLATVNERKDRGDPAMEKAEARKPGMNHAIVSLYAWLKQRQVMWLTQLMEKEYQGLLYKDMEEMFGERCGCVAADGQAGLRMQLWRAGIEAELTGDRRSMWSMVELMTMWINMHLSYYLYKGQTLPSPSAQQYLKWAFEWTQTWPGQWTEWVDEWFRPIQVDVRKWMGKVRF